MLKTSDQLELQMKKVLFILSFIFMTNAHATFTIDNITQTQIDNLTEELGANFIFSTISSAKATGDLLPAVGVEAGIVVGATDSPNWFQIIRQEDPTTDIDKLPYLNFIGAVSFRPLGLTFELGFIPEKSSDGATIKNTAVGVKWTFIDHGLYQFATRIHHTSNELSFVDTDAVAGGSVKGTTSFDTSITGIQLLAGANLLGFIEPYAGIGFVKSSTDTKLSANLTVNDVTLAGKLDTDSSHSSFHMVAGAVFDLFLINLGVEYMNALGTSRIAGKFSINI